METEWNYLKIYDEDGNEVGFISFIKGSLSEEKTVDYLIDNGFKFQKINKDEYEKSTTFEK